MNDYDFIRILSELLDEVVSLNRKNLMEYETETNKDNSNHNDSVNIGEWEYFNRTNYPFGFFNAKEPTTIMAFNKPTPHTLNNFKRLKGYQVLMRKPAGANPQKWWDSLKPSDKQAVMGLPNFDEKIFKFATGINPNM